MNPKRNIALIYGSAREGRFCDAVADWAIAHKRAQGQVLFCTLSIQPARNSANERA